MAQSVAECLKTRYQSVAVIVCAGPPGELFAGRHRQDLAAGGDARPRRCPRHRPRLRAPAAGRVGEPAGHMRRDVTDATWCLHPDCPLSTAVAAAFVCAATPMIPCCHSIAQAHARVVQLMPQYMFPAVAPQQSWLTCMHIPNRGRCLAACWRWRARWTRPQSRCCWRATTRTTWCVFGAWCGVCHRNARSARLMCVHESQITAEHR